MSDNVASPGLSQRAAQIAMAACLPVMALALFANVVLRYSPGSGIGASEELSRPRALAELAQRKLLALGPAAQVE